jgi:uncharacterized protein YdeI (YjbR/CyaY-like superfamily)
MMSTFDNALEISSDDEWTVWLVKNGASERQVWVIIYKKASKKQTVTFDTLLETALCYGWVDVQTKGVDEERYGIRFTARKVGSNWSATNRAIVRRLLETGRMKEPGIAVLPTDL